MGLFVVRVGPRRSHASVYMKQIIALAGVYQFCEWTRQWLEGVRLWRLWSSSIRWIFTNSLYCTAARCAGGLSRCFRSQSVFAPLGPLPVQLGGRLGPTLGPAIARQVELLCNGHAWGQGSPESDHHRFSFLLILI
jgi:hypothetical protein